MTITYNDAAMHQRTACLKKRIRQAIEHAVMAPSGHNAQPWKFRMHRDSVDILADRNRSLPVVDPDDRELTISCGAALFHLRLALHHDALSTLVRVLPDPANSDLLARVRISGPHTSDEDEAELFRAIPKRRTNRNVFDAAPVPPSVHDEWYLDAKSEGCWIQLFDEEETKHAIADLVTEGDLIQGSDKAFRHELAKWVHSNRSACRDGMPGYAHGVGTLASYLGPVLVRTFDWGEGQAAKDRQLAEGSPLLVIIGTPRDTPADWIACGQTLAKMLLRGTSRGLSASFLNQPIEVASLRPQLNELCENEGFSQILLRWGYGREVQPTPRRNIEEMLI
ncbi:Acg family FMN-binding oxidoreductase [Aporhodopirellula aestuarii]|uniref:Nitroreductase n=1 Tax=Aporhodopirellula aestuarii TaxID=2950107 RepID=A0ABT0TZ01_9BACT|nr:hypothetical protein [Aporhodopirellula aestuarii]MCM2369716.1 hypothetical protein [Aporhodopirellula aestuarii]